MNFYTISPLELWGDYGAILVNGHGWRQDPTPEGRYLNRDAPLVLDRTGPFVPPVFMPMQATLVVPDGSRSQLEQTSDSLRFRSVVKNKITWSTWHEWDHASECPKEYPPSHEPEGYLDDASSSDEAAARIGDLWELLLERGAYMELEDRSWRGEPVLRLDTWNGSDLFWSEVNDTSMAQWAVATEKGRDSIEGVSGNWLQFSACATR